MSAVGGDPPQKKHKESATGAVKAAIKVLAGGDELDAAVARDAMRELMSGEAADAQVGAFLALLNLDRCKPAIVHACAEVMRTHATPLEVPRNGDLVIDIVGTGGDGQDTFNISTAASLVAAGAGASVVKHGNRSASSKSGAADVLEALGVQLELAPMQVPVALGKTGFAFLFARSYHPAMKHVGRLRTELGIRTVFNILGPLTNPGKPDGILCGVFSPELGRLFVEVFKMLNMKRALVVHGCEGLDELSIAGPSKVWELNPGGDISEYEVSPSDFGVDVHPLSEVKSGSPEENAAEMRQLLTGAGRKAVRDMIVLNAGAALYVAEKVADFKAGATLAAATLSDGRATRAMEAYVAASKEAAP